VVTAFRGRSCWGDFDGDQRIDLIRASGRRVVLLDVEDAAYGQGAYFTEAEEPQDAEFADFTGDGITDMLVADSLGSLITYEGGPDGSLTFLGSFDADVGAFDAAIADFDGAGLEDIAAVNSFSDTVTIRPRVPDIPVVFFGPELTFPVGSLPIGLEVLDLDGSGTPDLLVVNRAGGSVSVLLNDPVDGGQPAVEYPVLGRVDAFELADVDGARTRTS